MVLVLCSCSEGQRHQDIEAKKTTASIIENRPGSVPTTSNGYMMHAKLEGKIWMAISMMPPSETGRIIGYNHGEDIGLPYDSLMILPGTKIIFGESNSVDLSSVDDVGMWMGKTGEMEITAMNDHWLEGKFFFTATSSNSKKSLSVTDGFFRIPRPKNSR